MVFGLHFVRDGVWDDAFSTISCFDYEVDKDSGFFFFFFFLFPFLFHI